ncbi:MATE family efflux transporter [Marispirochaeta aestuarii]|uniref:MATE family efflux transporter n=1 Tax=Marispirochaeta aestuarii TaxID=1963862 RepID=UPI0029C9AEF8|nr:MATE family efflux transporter [Marispirochaeta aestuarii]
MNIRPDRKFLASLVSLALPIAAQSFLLSSVNLIDNFMIGRLGESSIAAVALGNQVYFLVMMLLFGVTSGAGIFVSQFWGKRDLATIHRIQGLTLLVSFSACLIVSVTAVAVPEGLIGLLTTDTAVIREGARYLRIVAFSYPLTAITFSFVMVLRSCGFTRIPFNAAAAALSTNVVLNAVLIFGMFGFPALGVRGAALGTLIARALETCIIIVLSYRRERPSAAPLKELIDWNMPLIRRIRRTSLPVVFNEIGWSTGMVVLNSVFARIGTEAIAARNIADTVFRMLMVLFVGMGNGAHIMIGNAIGSGNEQSARRLAGQFSLLSPMTAVCTGTVLAAVSPLVPQMFSVSPVTSRYIIQFLLIIALVFPFKALSIIQIVGIFRGGGDTRFSMALDVGGVWLIGIPLAITSGLILQWPVWLVFLLASSEEIIKSVIGIYRTISDKWINNLTEDEPGIPLDKAPK